MRRHVLHGLLDRPQHPLVDAERAPLGPIRARDGPVGRDRRQVETLSGAAHRREPCRR